MCCVYVCTRVHHKENTDTLKVSLFCDIVYLPLLFNNNYRSRPLTVVVPSESRSTFQQSIPSSHQRLAMSPKPHPPSRMFVEMLKLRVGNGSLVFISFFLIDCFQDKDLSPQHR